MKKVRVITLLLVIMLFPTAGLLETASAMGDINGDGRVGLRDVIMALQLQAGIKQSDNVQLAADVNKDGRLGIAEVIYGLQIVAGLRQEFFAWTYKGELRQGGVDATTFAQHDGTYRQFYSNSVTGGQSAASSKDGLVWTEEGSAGLPENAGGAGGQAARWSLPYLYRRELPQG